MRRGRPRTQRGPTPRTASLALALTLGAVLAPAQTLVNDRLVEAWRRLRETAVGREALPASALTRDVGQIAVLEHDGANYDSELPGGGLNYAARERVGRRFYESHGDDYDFLVAFTNFEFQTGDATAFHLVGRNDVEGIGKLVGSAGSEVFGSRSRLKGWIDMAAIDRYRAGAFGTRPGEAGFIATLNVLAHEVGHQWLAQARFVDGSGRISDDLLGRDGTHWSYLLDSDASLLYGAKWVPDGPGLFHAARVKEQYSALDRYLMGFLPAEKVQPFSLLRNPGIDPRRINREGEDVAGVPEAVSLQQVVAALGPRRPDAVHSQKEFRLGFVFLTRPGTEPSVEDLDAVERIRRAFGAHFFALTHGIAWADTTLVDAPAGPRAPAPDLERALAWLRAQQRVDGRWQDSLETCMRDTATAVTALLRAGTATPAWQRGLAWLLAAQPESLDYRARSILAATAGGGALPDREAWLAAILVAQNPDGGFGAGLDFGSDALDTALALRALSALAHPADARVARAVAALAALASAGGGWPAVAGGEASTIVTAEVLLALLDWREVAGASALQANGLAALLSRQNPDGGFGSSPSTPLATALALDVLLRAGAPGEIVDDATRWLEQSQLSDGSWNGSPHQTALVIGALRASTSANLTVPVAALRVTPSPATEGEEVQVVARIRNVGRAPAPATVARLFDAPPATSPALGEVPVVALAAGAETEVTFLYPTSGRAGGHTLYVVADAAGTLRESREDDNTASSRLEVTGPLADLEVTPADIVVTPAAPEAGEAALVSVTVRNRGERLSSTCALAVVITDPDGRGLPLPAAMIPQLAPSERAVVSLSWRPEREGLHSIRATADAMFRVPESNEVDNTAVRAATVLAGVPEGAELSLVDARLMPPLLEELPQAIEARAIVQNAGRMDTQTEVAVIDDRLGGAAIGSATVPVPPRSSVPVVVPLTITEPGARLLRLVVDPANEIGEANESDNTVFARLDDGHVVDVTLAAASLSATDVVVGQPVTLTAEVRNTGTVDVPSIPVQFAREGGGALSELARTSLALPAGQSRTVTLSWTPVVAAGDLSLVVRVDPFGLLPERREDDNAVPLSLLVRPSGLPNLSVTGAEVAAAPDPPIEGRPGTVAAVVHNTGSAAAGEFSVRFFLGDPDHDGLAIGELTLGSLAAGAATTATLDWTPDRIRGALGLYVLVDARQQIEESVESDNRAFRPLSVIGLPDLVVSAADVVLDPGYPRAGEVVTVRTLVRNLGGQPSIETSLTVREGEGAGAQIVGGAPIPALAPGGAEVVSLPWTPAVPAGGRLLEWALDPDDAVVEQDEGNNTVRKTVVVQDADLSLTNPYFSPNGDGIRDETTLAWRATGPVRVVVQDSRGRTLRVLVGDGPAMGSASWDGRDEGGVLVWDGAFALAVDTADGLRLGQVLAVVDTNRSTIHEATADGQAVMRNLTCSLPDYVFGPAWLPGDEEALFIVPDARPGFPVGLVRASLDGSFSYVAQEEWYRTASLPDGAVSPDGAEVMIGTPSGAYVVDLATGGRRAVPGGIWSPDGRFLLNVQKVYTRAGEPVADISEACGHCTPYGDPWVWAPTSDRLASGNVIVARDGTLLAQVELPWTPEEKAGSEPWLLQTVWRGDGAVVITYDTRCVPDGEGQRCNRVSFRIDPSTGAVDRLPVGAVGTWSPDGSRVILPYGAEVLLESGASVGHLPSSSVTPSSTGVWLTRGRGDIGPPSGAVCSGKITDTFLYATLHNLVATFDLQPLPARRGIVVRGTASDLNLEYAQLDYALASVPGVWHPIGAPVSRSQADDVLAVWVPPGPDSYLVRLRVADLAGNQRSLVRTVRWDVTTSLANLTQSRSLISPNDDGVLDTVEFSYLVLDPLRLDVRIVGPEADVGGTPPVVRRFAFEHATLGPKSFEWDGRDEQNQVVPDGRYTVFVNEIPLRVDVDGTPPELHLRLNDVKAAPATYLTSGSPTCLRFLSAKALGPDVTLGTVVGERILRVRDRQIKDWRLGVAARPGQLNLTLASGRRDVDALDSVIAFPYLRGDLVLEAVDEAGNRSAFELPAQPEQIWPLGAAHDCVTLAPPPVETEAARNPPFVHHLTPERLLLAVGTNLQGPIDAAHVRFAFQRSSGGAWTEVPKTDFVALGVSSVAIEHFAELGSDPRGTYRGRFLANGATGEIVSESFLFQPCDRWLQSQISSTADQPLALLTLTTQLDEEVRTAKARLKVGPGPIGEPEMTRAPDGSFFLRVPKGSCAQPLTYEIQVETVSGRRYPDSKQAGACQGLSGTFPAAPCAFAVAVEQVFPGCGGSPDSLRARVSASASRSAHVAVEAGPPSAPIPVTSFDLPLRGGETGFSDVFDIDVRGLPGGQLPVRATLTPLDPQFDPVDFTGQLEIDRTPPTAQVFLPPEDGWLCRQERPDGRFAITTTSTAHDAAAMGLSARWRAADAPWRPLAMLCSGGACPADLKFAPDRPATIDWDGSLLSPGANEVALDYCDRAGNVGTTTRRLRLAGDSPKPTILSVGAGVFSPNGDGRLDEATVRIRPQPGSALTIRVRSGSSSGPLVRTLVADHVFGEAEVPVSWDGRQDDGEMAPDGVYAVVFSAANACGGRGEIAAAVALDTVPPEVAISTPRDGLRLSGGFDVLGRATDTHFGSWELAVQCGGSADWLRIDGRTLAVRAGGFLATWDTSQVPPGDCRLRLVAQDRAENTSAAAVVSVVVDPGAFVKALKASPDVFSPNGDGRRETATLSYELSRAARVRLQVRDEAGQLVRALEDQELRAATAYSHVWDGLSAAGGPCPEGNLFLWIRAEDPASAAVFEEQAVRLGLDRTPPRLAIAAPASAGFARRGDAVRGSVTDRSPLQYLLQVSAAGGIPAEIGRGTDDQSDAVLGWIAALDDGAASLRLTATDVAENTAELTLPLTIDSTPPRASITTPENGSLLLGGDRPIPVTGWVTETNLQAWNLRFGSGETPAALAPMAAGETTGSALSLGAWDVRSLPDGPYTLSLLVTDRAGSSTDVRSVVTLDRTPPTAVLTAPAPGGYLKGPTPVEGSVADASLDAWHLDVAPGDAAHATQWSPIASGGLAVSGALADWSALPPDGVYTLRLLARDKVGLSTVAKVDVVVDTTPPAMPTGLEGAVAHVDDGHGRVRLSWVPNTEPDLAGYRVQRDAADLHAEAHASAEWDDGPRLEGRYVYTVAAVDRAGNESPAARLNVTVDVTPPTLAFTSPVAGASVSASVEIRGTAYSAEDFAEFRLSVGSGETPTSWTILRRSTLPVAAGHLGEWLPVADGPYQLALEAEDRRGNAARLTRRIVVDTVAPAPPVLVSVTRAPAPADWLTPTWDPSASTDVRGYLVYRNGRLANAAGLVVGDPAGYLVPPPSFEDRSLPDGRHCYTVSAVDNAGNVSLPSNEICQWLDNRAPRAVLLLPADHSRFGEAEAVLASTPDLDLARVRFELKAPGDVVWVEIGTVGWTEGEPTPRWEVILDPVTLDLAPGDYDLRAVATDRGGSSDPSPAAIRVTYGDTTAPAAPSELTARVDGADVTLSWRPLSDAGEVSYRVYRDGVRRGDGIAAATLADPGLEPRTYGYVVTAVDRDGNESAPSAPAEAIVYALRLEEPDWPVRTESPAALDGDGARSATTVHVNAGAGPIASVQAAGGIFRIEGIPLSDGRNGLTARGEDALGNRSIPSNEVVLIGNTRPAAVSGLEATVEGHEVGLRWAAGAEPDLFGYVVRRDGRRLARTVAQTEAASVEGGYGAAAAFDGDLDTAWPGSRGTGEWTASFAQPILVERVLIRFAGRAEDRVADYTLLASWQGRYLPIGRVRGNDQPLVEHVLPSPFATSSLRLVLESAGRVAEVGIDRLDVVLAAQPELVDPSVPDGRHEYDVRALDAYGAESAPARVSIAVGDLAPPLAPTGLVATTERRDVRLAWTASPGPDVIGYVVLRGGVRIGTTDVPEYRDRGLADGTYVYSVIAIDASALESEESQPATAVVEALAPAAPVLLQPTDATHPITLPAARSDVGGRADAGSTVELEVNGRSCGSVSAAPSLVAAAPLLLPDPGAAVSRDGSIAWNAGGGTIALRSGAEDRRFATGGVLLTAGPVFSPDGTELAFGRQTVDPVAGVAVDLAVLSVADGVVRSLSVLPPVAIGWSPDGRQIAFSAATGAGNVLAVADAAGGAVTEIERSSGVDQQISWSPDGRRLAALRAWQAAVELRLVDIAARTSSSIDPRPRLDSSPSWSPDARQLAWSSLGAGHARVRVLDLGAGGATAEISEPDADAIEPRFSPDGQWLSHVRLATLDDGRLARSLRLAPLRGAGLALGSSPEAVVAPGESAWLAGRPTIRDGATIRVFDLERGWFSLRDVALEPGVNMLVARASDPATGLLSAASEAVVLTIPNEAFPNLAVEEGGIETLPSLPRRGRPAYLRIRVKNLGTQDASDVTVAVRVLRPDGGAPVETSRRVASLSAGDSAWVSVPWTPLVIGRHEVRVEIDPEHAIRETSEEDNTASRPVFVVEGDALVATVASDRPSYPARSAAVISVRLDNPGPAFAGTARTTVEDTDGREVAVLDEREVSIDTDHGASWSLTWNTGPTWAGHYAFHVRARAAAPAAVSAHAETSFEIEPSLSVLARVRPEPVTVAAGLSVAFALTVENRGLNAPLEGATVRLRVQPEGAGGTVPFETLRALPSLLPAGSWSAVDSWPAAQPAGRYAVRLDVERAGVVLASAAATTIVEAAGPAVRGDLVLTPEQVLAGQSCEAVATLVNAGPAPIADYLVVVEVVSGPEATVRLAASGNLALPAGEPRSLRLLLETTGLEPGRYPVRLRGGGGPATLDRATLVVHGLLGAPSPHAPADGATVATAHPTLVVNDATSPEGAALSYEFELFGDAALTQPLPGARGLAGTPPRTSWPVLGRLAEDASYWWRARATDGFSTSAWSAAVWFTVDAVNRPPGSPVPDSPLAGATVATRQPTLTVRNGSDPEGRALLYDFVLSTRPDASEPFAAQAGLAEGPGFTSWTVPVVLDEGATCYWSARVRDDAGQSSAWSDPIAFSVDTVNLAPSAPVPLRPLGVSVATVTPALVVANASDPEHDPLAYAFEIDTRPTLDSPARQSASGIGEGAGETAWTPAALAENSTYYWRAFASDGVSSTASSVASFFVNATNEEPGVPVPLDPIDDRTVASATPLLRLRNAVDPDGDTLRYEVVVRDAGGVLAAAADIPAGAGETTWVVSPPLTEDASFTWTARARDAELAGPWSAPAAFRVDAVVEPPTAPQPMLPVDGSVVEERRPLLVVRNASSPDHLPLTYAFELDAVAADGSVSPVDRVEGVVETPEATGFMPSLDLADGAYAWRARAHDPQQSGPWSATARFEVRIDLPPAAPTGLRATAGNASVRLDWNRSGETDVTGYRVYRSPTTGGPYAAVAAVSSPAYLDNGLANGTTYYYVVTAVDARAESAWSGEAVARPEAPPALTLEVRFSPSAVKAECLLTCQGAARATEVATASSGGSTCPDWLYATLELPPGYEPTTIDLASLRLFGSVPVDTTSSSLVDSDRDGLLERRVRFRFAGVAPWLLPGSNQPTIVGRAGTSEVRGSAPIVVSSLQVTLRITPRTLQRRSCGNDVEARLTFPTGVAAARVSVASVRLNGSVPVKRRVSAVGSVLLLQFDRAAVAGLLPLGAAVEVRVTGTLAGLPFSSSDFIRVIE